LDFTKSTEIEKPGAAAHEIFSRKLKLFPFAGNAVPIRHRFRHLQKFIYYMDLLGRLEELCGFQTLDLQQTPSRIHMPLDP